MQMLKKLAIVAALSSIAAAASAMTPIADKELSKVSGQDGVSIAADLNINIGNFTYTNTSADGGSVSFNNIKVGGTFAMTLDVMSAASFNTSAFSTAAGGLGVLNPTAMAATDPAAAGAQGAALTAFYGGSDVVKIAIPNIAVDAGHALNMSVDSITMGGSTKSFGKMALNDLKLQGTTVYIFPH
jgi:hypothetical protein